jgi:hypothetical protein
MIVIVSRVESPTDPSGEVMTVVVLMLRQILTKLEKPHREQVDASKISAGGVKEYFKCGRREVPVGSALNSLLSFNSVDSTSAIYSAVKSLVEIMSIVEKKTGQIVRNLLFSHTCKNIFYRLCWNVLIMPILWRWKESVVLS